MVAVMEVSEKDIEALREAIDGCGGSSYTQAIAILDRLSPAPEVDEATVWAGKILTLLGISSGRIFSASRDVLREVLAAKDAERGHLVEGVATLEAQLEQQKYELATLRAENRPPEGYSVLRIAARDCLINVNGLGRMEGGWLLLEGVNLSVAPKAAERNTAEPEHRLSSERAIPAGEVVRSPSSRSSDGSGNTAEPAKTHGPGPWPGDPDHRETMPAEPWSIRGAGYDPNCEACKGSKFTCDEHFVKPDTDGSRSGGMSPGTNAGAVEVLWNSICSEPDVDAIPLLSKALTEAEARGRREALEGISEDTKQWVTRELVNSKNLISGTIKSGNMTLHYAAHDAFKALDELKRLMTGEK